MPGTLSGNTARQFAAYMARLVPGWILGAFVARHDQVMLSELSIREAALLTTLAGSREGVLARTALEFRQPLTLPDGWYYEANRNADTAWRLCQEAARVARLPPADWAVELAAE